MLPQWTIEKKRDGAELSTKEIHAFVEGFTAGSIPDYQVAALAMAIYFKGMTARETADLTRAMLESGTVIPAASIPGVKVDKHSTGGIGDKISIPLAPLVAACGAVVPMISGRGLGITGGTLDKLESIPGYRVGLDETGFLQVIRECGCAMIGQTAEIAPADKKLYALRDVTGTVPSIPLIVSSILSKKLAEGIDALVLDVKCGSGAFMKDIAQARSLARALVDTAAQMGCRATALITNMDQPLGRAVGNALEIREAIELLQGKGPDDVRVLTLELAKEMLRTAGIPDLGGKAAEPALHLRNGEALQRFRKMVAAQGGNLNADLPAADRQIPLKARTSGYLARVDAASVGRACLLLGAGRAKTEDQIDPAVGIADLRKVGERIEKDEVLCMIHSNGHENREQLLHQLESAFKIADHAVEPPSLILETLTG